MFCPTSSLVLWIQVWRLKTSKWIKPFARRAHLFSMKCSNFLWSNKLIWLFQQTYPKPNSITAFHHQSFLGDLRRGDKIAKLDKVCLLKNWEALFLETKALWVGQHPGLLSVWEFGSCYSQKTCSTSNQGKSWCGLFSLQLDIDGRIFKGAANRANPI